jgi:hypothetical protein
MKWSFFAGSVILTGYWLLAIGAPPAAVAAGITGAGLVTFNKLRRKA